MELHDLLKRSKAKSSCWQSSFLADVMMSHLSRSRWHALSAPLKSIFFYPKYLQVNSRDKQCEMRSSRSLGDLKGSLLKGSERVRKHSTGELLNGAGKCNVIRFWNPKLCLSGILVVSAANAANTCFSGLPAKCGFESPFRRNAQRNANGLMKDAL